MTEPHLPHTDDPCPVRALTGRPSPAALRAYAEEVAARSPVRFGLYVFGSAVYFLYFGASMAVLVAATLLCIELLRRAEVRLIRGGLAERRPRLAGAMTWIMPPLRGAGGSFVVVASWITPVESDAARLFAIALAMAFVFDVGFAFRSNRRGVAPEVAILTGTIVCLVVGSVLRNGVGPLTMLQVMTLMVFAYTFVTFAVDAVRFRERHRASTAALEAANAELRDAAEENRRLALVSRHATDGIVLLDADRRIEWANEGYHRLSGYAAGEVAGARLGDLVAPENDPGTVERIAAALADGRFVREELVRRQRSGRRIWVDVAITPIRDEDGAVSGFVSVERDVTRQKEHEAELADARRSAEAAARAKAAFLATMSHEIRTPLNGVLGTADLLREGATDPEQRLLAETITGSGEYLLRLIDNVLEAARLDADALSIEVEAFDARRLAETSVALLRPLARRKGVEIALHVGPGLPDRVLGDGGRVRQILLNLLGNAVKFTAEGEVRVDLAFEPGGRLRMTVADTGIGIPADRLEAVFETFTQADRDTARRFGGTGLGLAISRALARRMGGDISVRSAPGAGTTFTATVAVDAADAPSEASVAEEPGEGAAPARAAPPEGGAPRLLVVDDNRTNRFVIEKMLGGTRYRLDLVEDGPAAVRAAEELCPDLILMDISMPGMDGFETCRLIRDHERLEGRPAAIILALTANGARSERSAAREAGMDGFLTKPVRKAALLQAIAAHVEGPGGPPEERRLAAA